MLWGTHASPQPEVVGIAQRSAPGSVQQVWALLGMGSRLLHTDRQEALSFTREMGKTQWFGTLLYPGWV